MAFVSSFSVCRSSLAQPSTCALDTIRVAAARSKQAVVFNSQVTRAISGTRIKMVEVGDKAPDFVSRDQNGNSFKLSSFLGKNNVVLYFYPKDNTQGCTVQACTFNEQLPEFGELDAVIVGVSADSDHMPFINKYGLKFTLLSDADRSLRKLYNVPKAIFGLLDGRCTFVIDKNGIVRSKYDKLGAAAHVTTAKETLAALPK